MPGCLGSVSNSLLPIFKPQQYPTTSSRAAECLPTSVALFFVGIAQNPARRSENSAVLAENRERLAESCASAIKGAAPTKRITSDDPRVHLPSRGEHISRQKMFRSVFFAHKPIVALCQSRRLTYLCQAKKQTNPLRPEPSGLVPFVYNDGSSSPFTHQDVITQWPRKPRLHINHKKPPQRKAAHRK